MAQIMSTQNIKTYKRKCPDMQYKKQLKALCVSEKPLHKASNGMLWIKKYELTEELSNKRLLSKACWSTENENMVNKSDTLKKPNRMLYFL